MMKDKTDVLWGMYQEHLVYARHHETLRANVTNYILLVGGGVGTLVSSGGFTRWDLPLTILLILLGLFGAVFSASHSERHHAHKKRAYAYRDELDKLVFQEGNYLTTIKDRVDKEVEQEYPVLSFIVKTHWLWMAFPLIIAVLGVVLSVICWWFPKP
jgi:uncharacterized integral membrane protein